MLMIEESSYLGKPQKLQLCLILWAGFEPLTVQVIHDEQSLHKAFQLLVIGAALNYFSCISMTKHESI